LEAFTATMDVWFPAACGDNPWATLMRFHGLHPAPCGAAHTAVLMNVMFWPGRTSASGGRSRDMALRASMYRSASSRDSPGGGMGRAANSCTLRRRGKTKRVTRKKNEWAGPPTAHHGATAHKELKITWGNAWEMN